MSAAARSKGPSITTGAPSGCGHPECDPDECWRPAPAKPAPRRRPSWVSAPQRLVELKRCRSCKKWTWTGWDADLLAGAACVEKDIFLTTEGEDRAIARGRSTYGWTETPRRIDFRDSWRRQGAPAGGVSWTGRPVLVVVQHVCRRPVPEWAIYIPPRAPRKKSSPLRPPF